MLGDRYTFILGADNVFNTLPERVRPEDFFSFTSNEYITSGAFSPNGRFVYTRVQVNF